MRKDLALATALALTLYGGTLAAAGSIIAGDLIVVDRSDNRDIALFRSP
jgi:hypothetical protein